MHENVDGARGSQCWGPLCVPTRQVVWDEDGHDWAVLQVRVAVTGRRRPCDQELRSQRTRLLHAANFFRTRGISDEPGAGQAKAKDGVPYSLPRAAAAARRDHGGVSREPAGADGSPPFPRRVPRRANRRLAECAGRNRPCGRVRPRRDPHHPVQAHVRDAPRLHVRRGGAAHIRPQATRGDGTRRATVR